MADELYTIMTPISSKAKITISNVKSGAFDFFEMRLNKKTPPSSTYGIGAKCEQAPIIAYAQL